MESIIKVDYQDAVPGKNVYAVKLKKNEELELYTESEEYIKKQAALETAVKKPHCRPSSRNAFGQCSMSCIGRQNKTSVPIIG